MCRRPTPLVTERPSVAKDDRVRDGEPAAPLNEVAADNELELQKVLRDNPFLVPLQELGFEGDGTMLVNRS